MGLRPVVRYPASVLKEPAAPVGRVDDTTLALARDLVDTMRSSPGCVGLAAPQVGVGLRIICLDVSGHRHATDSHGLVVMFDPVVENSGDFEVRREGCLSVPHLTADVARARSVIVRGKGTDGRDRIVRTTGFEARAFLHEVDHLDGLLILDRVSSASSLFPRKVYL